MDETTKHKLAELGEASDEDFPLADGALLLAKARAPELNLSPYRRHLTRLTNEVREYAGVADPPLALMREALLQVVSRRHGYGGNEAVFEDLDAASLARVIDTRRGLPVALGIIYMEVCRRLGWALSGLDFPGRFVVRLEHGNDRLIMDLFEDGRELTPPDLRAMLKAVAGEDVELRPRYLEPMTARRVVLRLEDNIRVRQMQRGDLAAAADTIEAMLLVAPGAAHLWREAGLVNARLERIGHAVKALEEYLRHDPGAESGYEASLLLQELRARLN